MTLSSQRRLEIAGATLLAVVFTLMTYRHGRLLSFDGYHYVELAKLFSTQWPDRFGNHWPIGYPLGGGLLARAGLPAYWALTAMSVTAIVVTMVMASRMLGAHPWRGLVLAAIAAPPIVAIELGGVLTELPFAAVWLGLAMALAHWPSMAAMWAAAGCAVLALSIRYAGIIALAVLAAWAFDRWRDLVSTRRATAAIAALAAAVLVSASLLAINFLKSGHMSGAPRGTSEGIASLPGHLADFGWSIPSALVAGGLRDEAMQIPGAAVIFGTLLFTALIALCILGWMRPRSPYSRPLALTTIGYGLGIVILRVVGEFDALYNARTFLPILPVFVLLLVEQLPSPRTLTALLCGGLIASGLVAATRGISRQIGGDVRPAVAELAARLQPSDAVQVNDHALSLAAYLPHRVRRAWPEHWHDANPDRFLVIAAPPVDRWGSPGDIKEDWRALAADLLARDTHAQLLQVPGLLMLERRAPAAKEGTQ